MYLITFLAATISGNEDHGKVGEAYVNCWINEDTLDQAQSVARDLVSESHWEVLQDDEVSIFEASDFEDGDDRLQFFEQALIDGAVLVFHLCPKFPVYHVIFKVSAPSEDSPLQARAWIANECIDDDYDAMNLDFWSGSRSEQAVDLIAQSIRDHGFEVVELISQSPCNRKQSPDDVQCYDDAEESGMCILFERFLD